MAKAPSPTKFDHIKALAAEGSREPRSVLAKIKKLARNEDWRTREVAATVLVNISKKKPEFVLAEMKKWAKHKDENIRRTSMESMRGLARTTPESVVPHMECLREDSSLYVMKSVANIMRDASKSDAELITKLAHKWARSPNENTRWIVKNGIRKLSEKAQASILKSLGSDD